METLPFKPFSSGIRTLWILKFLPQPPDLPPPPKPPIDFYIPSPYGNEWFNTNPENTAKAQKILKQIQDTCQDIKTRAEDKKVNSLEEYIDKTKDIVKEIKNLDDILRSFNDFLKESDQGNEKEGKT